MQVVDPQEPLKVSPDELFHEHRDDLTGFFNNPSSLPRRRRHERQWVEYFASDVPTALDAMLDKAERERKKEGKGGKRLSGAECMLQFQDDWSGLRVGVVGIVLLTAVSVGALIWGLQGGDPGAVSGVASLVLSVGVGEYSLAACAVVRLKIVALFALIAFWDQVDG
jgi:hypothetical protein